MAEPRILELLGPSTGGIRRHVAFLTEQLRARGWTVATAGPSGVLEGLLRQDHEVPIPSGLALRQLPAARRRVRALLPGFELVHAHGLTAGWLAALAARSRRTPVVVTVHNLVLDEVAGWRAPILRALERRLAARVDAVIAVSEEVARALSPGADDQRIVVGGFLGPPPLPRRSPAAVRAGLGVERDAPLVVCVARLHPQKGLDVLLDAVAIALTDVPALRLVIVGEGPLEDELRGRAAALGLADRAVFGRSDHAVDELAAADVVTIPSRWESGPLVLGEAMILGRPVVATPVGAVPELVDIKTGWLVPVGEAVPLAAALVAALTDRTEAARRAAAGQARAIAQLDPGPRVSIVEQVYRASLGRR